jgi:lipopolysaccharide/colanic/teichoic acid biosynthesis glycosyltransferase
MRITFSDQVRRSNGMARLRNKRQWRALVLLLVVLDALCIAGALTLAYIIRIDGVLPYYHNASDDVYRGIVITAVPLWLLGFAAIGLYQRDNLLGGVVEYKQVVKGSIAGVMILVAYTVFARIPDFDVSRLWLVFSLLFSIILVGAMRFLVRRVAYKLRESGWLGSRVLIVGANDQGVAIAEQWMSSAASGMHVLGFLDDFKSIGTQVIGNTKVLGRPSALNEISKVVQADEIVVVSSAVAWESFGELVTSAGNSKDYTLRLSPGFYELLTTGVAVTNKTFVPLLTINENRIVGVDAVLKAIEDLGLGALTMLFTLPFTLLFGLILKLRHPRRPVLVRSIIIGQGGKPFGMLRFNTAPDPRSGRATRGFERWLRVTGLNKLPQLINVLQGEMSLVGPRPRAEYDRSINLHANHNLQAVKPGMVGPWMRRDHLASPNSLHDELNYVRKWQIWLDLPMLFQAAVTLMSRLFNARRRKIALQPRIKANETRRPEANWQEDLLT